MSGPLSFKVCLLDGDMIWRRHQDHLRQHQETTVTEPFGSSGEDPITETVPSLLPCRNPRRSCTKPIKGIRIIYYLIIIALSIKGGGDLANDLYNNARILLIVITPNHMHLDVIKLSFSFVRIAVVSAAVSHLKWDVYLCVFCNHCVI